MAKALGIGGVFFRCRDREKLAEWYAEALGFDIGEYGGTEFRHSALPEGAYSVWGPFAEATEYFAPSEREFMINLVVDDLDGALDRVERAGGRLVGEPEEYDYGRFGWFLDPEGTKVELWEPR